MSTGPFDGPVGHGRVATGPDAEADVHGRLREVVTSVRFFVFERTDERSIDEPVNLFGRPVDGVVVEVLLGLADGVVDCTIEGGRVALSEVVGLGVGGVAAHHFPIDLVQVVGLEHDTADDALSRGGLHDHLDGAEEDVKVRLDGRRVEAAADAEGAALSGILDHA